VRRVLGVRLSNLLKMSFFERKLRLAMGLPPFNLVRLWVYSFLLDAEISGFKENGLKAVSLGIDIIYCC